MHPFVNLLIYLVVGFIGGFLGAQTKLPAGVMLGAVLAVIGTKLIFRADWATPAAYGFICQVMLGVLIALTYKPGMFRAMGYLVLPIVISTVYLVLCGVLLALLFRKWLPLDLPTAYIATSPGGMSALVPMATDLEVNAALISAFHFFRIFFVVCTAPFIFKLMLK